jgi:hypothetical protein
MVAKLLKPRVHVSGSSVETTNALSRKFRVIECNRCIMHAPPHLEEVEGVFQLEHHDASGGERGGGAPQCSGAGCI